MLPICCLPLPGIIIKRLLDAGFMFAEDAVLSNNELHSNAENVLRSDSDSKSVLIDSLKGPKSRSAADLLEKENKRERILTFSYRLDKLLGGGFPLGALTEVCGAPGSGKTQMCLQLCVSVQLHARLGGLQAKAIYIDTDAGFSPQRLQEISEGCKDHCCKVAEANKFSTDITKFLEGQSFEEYHYVSVLDYTQLLATVFSLEDFIEENNKVKLVIIDSLPFPFLPVTDMLKRTTLLCKILLELKRLASKYNLSVVVTNHLTTRISRGEDQLVPALGECVGYLTDYRLMLGYLPTDQHFAGVIFKSPISSNNSAEFQVTRSGIRDIQSSFK